MITKSFQSIQVSLLGMGNMRLPQKGTASNSPIDWEASAEIIDYALAHGVNYFDTAPVYCQGLSEKVTGIALSRHPRDSYFIATKLSNFGDPSYDEAIRMYNHSMSELQTDHIDYYLLHSVGNGKALKDRFIDTGLLDYFLEERKAGHIRNLGFSYHGDVEVFDHAMSMHDKVHWDHVLIQHNYINWRHAASLADDGNGDANSEYLYGQLAARDIPIFVMEPLLGGQLDNLPQFAVDELKRREPQQSIASWAFRFAANQPRILTVLSGMTYMEHLQDNLRTMSPHRSLTSDEEALLMGIADKYVEYPLVPCTGCQYCMPCPYGIDIPGIFAHYNKVVNEGSMPDEPAESASGEERRAYRRARREYLKSYNHAVEPDRQADHCIGCGRCLAECPQQIDIPGRLAMIEKKM